MITKLNGSILEQLERIRAPHFYSAGETIFRQGELPDAFYYLKSGMAQTYTASVDGQSRTMMTLWPGALFGTSTFFENVPYRSTASAVKGSEIIRIDRAAFEVCLYSHPEFIGVLLESLAGDIGILLDQLADSKLLSSDAKVARFLCRRVEYGQYSKAGSMIKINFTQEFMSHVLGLSRWTVNRTLMDFREKGWISTAYGGIIIKDYKAVRACGYEK